MSSEIRTGRNLNSVYVKDDLFAEFCLKYDEIILDTIQSDFAAVLAGFTGRQNFVCR